MLDAVGKYDYLIDELSSVEGINDRVDYSELVTLEQKVDEEMKTIPKEIVKNMIISGGTDAHAIGFRFLLTELKIVFVNTGEGVEKHEEHEKKKKFYKLYKVWQFKKKQEFHSYVRKIRAAARCRDIAKIIDAYKFQVDVIPKQYEVKIKFKHDGDAQSTQPVWMTNHNNWEIHKGELFCRPQIAGSCTFYSLYWLLLLDVWEKSGSLAAGEFELKCRLFVLQEAIRVTSPVNDKAAEQISSLQLIVRLYRNFKGREMAIETLLLEQEPFDKNNFAAVTEEIPLKNESPRRLAIEEIFETIQKINICNDLTDEGALSSLHKLTWCMHHAVEDADKSTDTEYTNWFCMYLLYVLNTAIKKVATFTCKQQTNENHLFLCAESAEGYCDIRNSEVIYKAQNYTIGDVSTWDWQSTLLCNNMEFQGMFIGIMSKLHSKLDEKLKLDPHEMKYKPSNLILVNNTSCETLTFTEDYAFYMYNKNLLTTEQERCVEMWKKQTKPHRVHKARLATVHDKTVFDRTYEAFVKSSFVNEYVSLIFTFAVSSNGIPNKSVASTHLQFNKKSQFPPDQDNLQLATATTGFIADLNKSTPLSLLDTTDQYLLPQFENLVDGCAKGVYVINLNKPNTDMTDFHNLRTRWMKEAWIKAAPSIPAAAIDSNKFIIISIWLLYLWPAGPPPEIEEHLTKFTNEHVPMLSNMVAIWCRKGGLQNKQILANVIEQQRAFSKQDKKPDRWRLIIQLFASSLYYNEQTLRTILQSFDFFPGRSSVTNFKVLGGRGSLWPLHFRKMKFDVTFDKYMSPKTDKERILFPIGQRNWWNQIWLQCSYCNIPCVILETENRKQLRMYFENLYINLECRDNLFYLKTPSGDEYEVLPPHDVPPCMRPWCMHYEYCVALGLRQKKKLFLFIAGTYTQALETSIFDGSKQPNARNDTLWQQPPQWHIFNMHVCGGLLPVLNRDTPGWYFLLENLITSTKQSCLELIRPIVNLLTADESNEEKQMRPLVKTHWPSARSFKKTEDRLPYFKVIDDNLTEEPTYLSDAIAEHRLWHKLSTSVSPLPIERWHSLLLSVLQQKTDKELNNRTLFEIASGLVIRDNQRALLDTMERVTWPNEKSVVQTALMGIGKSKVLLPSLTIYCLRDAKTVKIVQPVHLVQQTKVTLDQIIPLVAPEHIHKYQVLSDTQAKREYLDSRIAGKSWDNNIVVLFDEIDSMYNCFRSEFNRPTSIPVAHPQIPADLMTSYYQLVVHSCYDIKSPPSILEQTHPDFWVKFEKNLKMCKNMKFLLQYGPTTDSLLAVPYSAVDTPVIGSNFSDIDITAVLTCLVRKQQGLTSLDFIFLQARLHQLQTKFSISKLLPSLEPDVFFALSLPEQVKKYGRDENLQIFYLSCVLLPEKLRSFVRQYNISFIDLMGVGFSANRIGFSGTTLMHIPTFSKKAWNQTIIPDTDGQAKIKAAIVGNSSDVYQYSYPALWQKLMQFEVLIDAGAMLRDKGAAIEIVKMWDQKEAKNYTYVFIDATHTAREYQRGAKGYPLYTFRAGITFRWYFDQPHTIGIDLEIDEKAKGLTLVDSDSLLTDVAQAIYRLRKIDSGQSVQFMTIGDSRTTADLYKHLEKNDQNYKQQLLGRHYLQNLKTVYRGIHTYKKETYEERVKYYPGIIDYKAIQGEKLFNDLLKMAVKYKDNGDTKVDVQVEQAREMLHTKNAVTCGLEETKINIARLADYIDPSWGKIIVTNAIYTSPMVRRALPKELDMLCVIDLAPSYKIITIEEWLLIRPLTMKTVIFRLDPLTNPSSTLLFALALCGRVLALDEQMKVIHEIEKEDLTRAATCFQRLDYDMFHEYLFGEQKSVASETFLTNAVISFDYFVNKWIRLPLQSEALLQYYNSCKQIIKKK